MKDFENIGKNMPYKESESYISDLIDRSTDMAVNVAKQRNTLPLWSTVTKAVAGIAAAVAIIVGIIHITSPLSDEELMAQVNSYSSIDEVLSSLSDEQIETLASYTVEFPEY